ncbi:hypothetical protein Tco_0374167 [Tanacetum coccineum]
MESEKGIPGLQILYLNLSDAVSMLGLSSLPITRARFPAWFACAGVGAASEYGVLHLEGGMDALSEDELREHCKERGVQWRACITRLILLSEDELREDCRERGVQWRACITSLKLILMYSVFTVWRCDLA